MLHAIRIIQHCCLTLRSSWFLWIVQAAKVEQAMHAQTKMLKLWSLDRESGESLSRAQSDLQHELAAQQVYIAMYHVSN
jgi:hypothetical protein